MIERNSTSILNFEGIRNQPHAEGAALDRK